MKPLSLSLLLLCLLTACQTPQSTVPLPSPTATVSPLASATPTVIPTSTLSPAPSVTPSNSPTPEPSLTPEPAAQPTASLPTSPPPTASPIATPMPSPTAQPTATPDPAEQAKLENTLLNFLTALNQQDLNSLLQTLNSSGTYYSQVKAKGNNYIAQYPYPLPLDFNGFSSLSSLSASTRSVTASAELSHNNKSYAMKLRFIKINQGWLIDTIFLP